MIAPDDFTRRINSFPRNYWEDFNRFWEWKVAVESNNSAHILDDKHKKETYVKLSPILSAWQTYRNGNNPLWRETLEDSLGNISETYNKLRKYSLLDFDSIHQEILEKAWHELGRVKERNGQTNESGYYSIISISKPLMLMWGQTLAFDSQVRKNLSKDYRLQRYSCNWSMDNWIRIMKLIGKSLTANKVLVEFIQKEAQTVYGKKSTVPYGRFLDIFYWAGN